MPPPPLARPLSTTGRAFLWWPGPVTFSHGTHANIHALMHPTPPAPVHLHPRPAGKVASAANKERRARELAKNVKVMLFEESGSTEVAVVALAKLQTVVHPRQPRSTAAGPNNPNHHGLTTRHRAVVLIMNTQQTQKPLGCRSVASIVKVPPPPAPQTTLASRASLTLVRPVRANQAQVQGASSRNATNAGAR